MTLGALFLSITHSKAQKSSFFLEPEFMVGKNVANYDRFPETVLRKTYALNVGWYKNDTLSHANIYYNFPHTGVSIAYSDLGNRDTLGSEYSITPYILLNATPRLKNSLLFKFGLGASYFTKKYENQSNRYNRAIGSALNWNFQAFLYYSFWTSENVNLKLGAGYWHSSNSHMQLPNYGLNAGLFTIAGSYYFRDINPYTRKRKTATKDRTPFIQVRSGIGLHELGSTIGPVGTPKKPVYTLAFSYGILFNHQLKLYTGLFYRYYTSFYHYLKTNTDKPDNNLEWQASNVNFYVGCEYLLGHVGMNLEGGINLYKPFYSTFYELYENGDDFNYFRMKTFNTRLGLNLYLKNTKKRPDQNLALGAHINANFGKADFGEINLTYMKMIK